jgi:hypothetical protein
MPPKTLSNESVFIALTRYLQKGDRHHLVGNFSNSEGILSIIAE